MNELYRMLLEAVARGQRITRKTDTATGDEALFIDGSLAWGDDIKEGLEENLVAEPVLVLFGAGHVSKALYDIASLHSMRTIILDDRETELTEERFPKAERHIGPFEELLQREYDAPSPYFVIFTHGHSYDLDALRYCLSHRFSYLGMIGSKAKSASQIETVRSEGFPEERIAAIHSPIGLSINAVTPEEIAISIMAEIISVYRKDRKAVTVDTSLVSRMLEEDGIVVRIIEKQGSAPRSVGSMMFVNESSTYSTVGGGRIESLAIEEARKLLKSGEEKKIVSYDLGKGGNAGMICGGSVKLLLTRKR